VSSPFSCSTTFCSNKQTPLPHRCSRKFLPLLVHETDAWTAPNPNHRAVAASPDGNPSRRREFGPQSSRGKRGRVDRRRKKVRAGGRSGGGEAGKRLSPVAKGATCFFHVADAERVAEFSRRRRLEEALRACCSSARVPASARHEADSWLCCLGNSTTPV
jgi:hypothetical protein